MIKESVISRALKKVREDPQIFKAIEARKSSHSPAEFRANYID
jgi:hypothetical protein